MSLSIELSDDPGSAVKAKAQEQGVSPDRLVSRILESALGWRRISLHPDR